MTTCESSVCYEREDWTLFRSIRTISQGSGVPPELLRRLVAKELTDNALDAGGTCRVGELLDVGFFVEDDGPGIDGQAEEVARLFSFRRPLVSSKVKRLPSRGALGNGLRVVAGAVYASRGSLRVITRGRALDLEPQESGETLVRKTQTDRRAGTRVEVYLGDGIPEDPDFLEWAQTAIDAAGQKPIYARKTSLWFYDSDAFFEMLKAAGTRTVQDVLADFDGAWRRCKRITGFRGRSAASLSYDEAEELLRLARSAGKPIRPQRLALLKKGLPGSYAKSLGTLTLAPGRGSLEAKLPYTVEAWCSRSCDDDTVKILVNRSPVTGDVQIERADEKTNVNIFGCNLGYRFKVGCKPVDLVINVQIPYMPITSNGKEPDLEHFLSDLQRTVAAAARKCQRANPSSDSRTLGALPSLPKGRPSDEARADYEAELAQFADKLKEIGSRVDFKVSSRGWCYILENECNVPKGDFDKAQDLINHCRKTGLLPIDFTVEDEARGADNLEQCDGPDAKQHAMLLAQSLRGWERYTPVSFWDFQPVYIQVVVEKIDLKSLFLPVCREYHVPIMNARGWSDLNLRAGLMRRFKEHELKGRRPILSLCGDHDPVGLQICDSYRRHLEELANAVGWSPENLVIERFGLNFDFIDANHLTWIDGLQTGSGKDLGNVNHRQHRAHFVQDYIRTYGSRKVEANALVVRPEAGRQLCRDALERHLDLGAIATYQQALLQQRGLVRTALPGEVARFLNELGNTKT
jgi:hypothetical protein